VITLITDRLICKIPLLAKIEALVEEHRIDQVILREKDLNEKALYDLYISIEEILKGTSINLIVNASIAFAKKYKIHQIHLSQKNFRKINDKKELENISFGVSVHSLKEVEMALSLEPNYLLVSPIFKTNCKKGNTGLGIGFIKRIQGVTNTPLIALGGIDDRKISQLKALNINSIAMRSNLLL